MAQYIKTPSGEFFEDTQFGLKAVNDPTTLRGLQLGTVPYSTNNIASRTFAPEVSNPELTRTATPASTTAKPPQVDLSQLDNGDPIRKFNLALLDMLKRAQAGETKLSREQAQLKREAYQSGQEVFTGDEALMSPEAKLATLKRNVEMFEPSVQAATTRIKQLGDTIDLIKTTYGEDFSKLMPATPEEGQTIKNAIRAGITVDTELLKRYAKYLTEDDFIAYAEAKRTPKETYSSPYTLPTGETAQRNLQTGEIKVISKELTPTGQISDTAASVMGNINDLLVSDLSVWNRNVASKIPGNPAQLTVSKLNQVLQNLALNARQMIKGTGTISDFEARMLQDAQTILSNTKLSEEAVKQELKKIRAILNANAGKSVEVQVLQNGQIIDEGLLNREEIYDAVSQGYQIIYK